MAVCLQALRGRILPSFSTKTTSSGRISTLYGHRWSKASGGAFSALGVHSVPTCGVRVLPWVPQHVVRGGQAISCSAVARPLAATARAHAAVHSDPSTWYGTTILCLKRGKQVVMIGDGQVSLGNTVLKANARKLRRLKNAGTHIEVGRYKLVICM